MKSSIIIFLVSIISFECLAKHNNRCIYQLPFQLRTSHRVLQAYGGSYSHLGPLKYALDFEMPIGTKIYAARAGHVLGFSVDQASIGSKSKKNFSKANFIQILHRDDTIGFYVHLKKGGALVDVGEYVKQGELIALSGCSGYCDGAHLHFEVFKWRDKQRISIPLSLFANQKVDKNLKRQSQYRSNLAPLVESCLQPQTIVY